MWYLLDGSIRKIQHIRADFFFFLQSGLWSWQLGSFSALEQSADGQLFLQRRENVFVCS